MILGTVGVAGLKLIGVGKLGVTAAGGVNVNAALFTNLGVIPALNSKSTKGSLGTVVLPIPYWFLNPCLALVDAERGLEDFANEL